MLKCVIAQPVVVLESYSLLLAYKFIVSVIAFYVESSLLVWSMLLVVNGHLLDLSVSTDQLLLQHQDDKDEMLTAVVI